MLLIFSFLFISILYVRVCARLCVLRVRDCMYVCVDLNWRASMWKCVGQAVWYA